MLPLNFYIMRKFTVIFCIAICCTKAFAQNHEPVNTKKDQRQFNGYTIRLLPSPERTYGYEVILGGKRVIYQTQNPFTASPRGLSKKEDAFKVAQFQIQQREVKTGVSNQRNVAATKGKKLDVNVAQKAGSKSNDETVYNQHLSPKVAEKLKISITQ